MFKFNEKVVDSLDKEAMELYDSCLNKQSLFEMASSVLVNHVEEFDDLDTLFFSKLLKVPRTAQKESYYLELGAIPIRILTKARRVKYFQQEE